MTSKAFLTTPEGITEEWKSGRGVNIPERRRWAGIQEVQYQTHQTEGKNRK